MAILSQLHLISAYTDLVADSTNAKNAALIHNLCRFARLTTRNSVFVVRVSLIVRFRSNFSRVLTVLATILRKLKNVRRIKVRLTAYRVHSTNSWLAALTVARLSTVRTNRKNEVRAARAFSVFSFRRSALSRADHFRNFDVAFCFFKTANVALARHRRDAKRRSHMRARRVRLQTRFVVSRSHVSNL